MKRLSKEQVKGVLHRVLMKCCTCTGIELKELGFKEGQFIHAPSCPIRLSEKLRKKVGVLSELI